MRLTRHAAGRLAAAAITSTAILLPAAAIASPGPAAAAGSPAPRARQAHPVTAWVTSLSSYSVTLINTATNKVSKAIKVGEGPGPIAITPNGKTAYVGIELGCHSMCQGSMVVPVSTATDKAGKAIKVGSYVVAFAVTPDGKTVYADVGGGAVVPISTATNKAGKAIKVAAAGSVTSRSPRTGRLSTSPALATRVRGTR